MLVSAGNVQFGDCIIHEQKQLLVLKNNGLAGGGYVLTVAHNAYEEVFRIMAKGTDTFRVVRRLGKWLEE